MKNFKEKLTTIKAFAFDCDGVLTDGSLLVTESGEMLRKYDSKDGHAIKIALKNNFPIAVISGGTGAAMKQRFEILGIKNVYLSSYIKTESLADFMQQYGLEPHEVLYIGDDIPDICVMKEVGISVAPADAAMEVKRIATYVSDRKGGYGCVRDALEQVLKAKGCWKWE